MMAWNSASSSVDRNGESNSLCDAWPYPPCKLHSVLAVIHRHAATIYPACSLPSVSASRVLNTQTFEKMPLAADQYTACDGPRTTHDHQSHPASPYPPGLPFQLFSE